MGLSGKPTICSCYRSKRESKERRPSRSTRVDIQTIRHERIGALPKPGRQINGRRTYAERDAGLGFIRHVGDLGFDLADVRTSIAAQKQPTRE